MQIILADHHPQALWALRTMLQEMPKITVIGSAVNSVELFALVKAQTPDLVLIDQGFPGSPLENLIQDLHEYDPRPIVVVMGTKQENRRTMLDSEADAFVSKTEQPEWLMDVLTHYEKRMIVKKQ
jgi:DNA-binding NarL/FixJ family response regulator